MAKLLSMREHTAMQKHTCDYCGTTIWPQHIYRRYGAYYENSNGFSGMCTYKACSECADNLKHEWYDPYDYALVTEPITIHDLSKEFQL